MKDEEVARHSLPEMVDDMALENLKMKEETNMKGKSMSKRGMKLCKGK